MAGFNQAIRVLVVDDDISFCSSLADVLDAKGYEATTETDPRKVLGILADNKVDVILVDMVMPHLGGLQLIHLVRQAHRNLPIIVVSARRTAADTIAATRCGASEFLTKPVDFEFLEMRLLRACHIESVRQ